MQIRQRENRKTRAAAAAAKSKSSETEKETSQMKKGEKKLPSSQSYSSIPVDDAIVMSVVFLLFSTLVLFFLSGES